MTDGEKKRLIQLLANMTKTMERIERDFAKFAELYEAKMGESVNAFKQHNAISVANMKLLEGIAAEEAEDFEEEENNDDVDLLEDLEDGEEDI